MIIKKGEGKEPKKKEEVNKILPIYRVIDSLARSRPSRKYAIFLDIMHSRIPHIKKTQLESPGDYGRVCQLRIDQKENVEHRRKRSRRRSLWLFSFRWAPNHPLRSRQYSWLAVFSSALASAIDVCVCVERNRTGNVLIAASMLLYTFRFSIDCLHDWSTSTCICCACTSVT